MHQGKKLKKRLRSNPSDDEVEEEPVAPLRLKKKLRKKKSSKKADAASVDSEDI